MKKKEVPKILQKSPPIPDKFKPIAEALGGLAMDWGGLEQVIALLLGKMLNLKYPEGKAILGNIEFRNKLAILKSYGVVMKPNGKWYEELIATVNEIENHLSPERNHMFHDFWRDSRIPGTMTRLTMKPGFNDEQGLANRELKHIEEDITTDTISDLSFRVQRAHIHLYSLFHLLKIESASSRQK